MAGDWIKVEKDTPEKPEVYRIAEILGVSQADAFLACFRFWRWADCHTEDGLIRSTTASIDDAAQLPNFHMALREVGWLNLRSGAVEVPNFIRHMGISAKKRIVGAVRKMSYRAKDKSATREEKRRDKPPLVPRDTDADFESFWNAFPKRRRTAKAKAREAWDRALKLASPSVLIEAAAEYAASQAGQGEYAKMPSSWLNGQCWLDDREAWNPASGNVAGRLPTPDEDRTWNPLTGIGGSR